MTLRLLLIPLTLVLLGSTCVVIEEGPEDIPYGEESNTEAMQEEQAEEIMRESDR